MEEYIELPSSEPEGDFPSQPVFLAYPSQIPKLSSFFSQHNSETRVDGSIIPFLNQLNLKKRKLEEDMKNDRTQKKTRMKVGGSIQVGSGSTSKTSVVKRSKASIRPWR
ncbi:hypothetical protein Ancab_034289, partial [Ancistrocladus abbreviatus]